MAIIVTHVFPSEKPQSQLNFVPYNFLRDGENDCDDNSHEHIVSEGVLSQCMYLIYPAVPK